MGKVERSVTWSLGERRTTRQAMSGARGPGDAAIDDVGAPWLAVDVTRSTENCRSLGVPGIGILAILGGGDVTQRRAGEGSDREGEARRDRVWARAQGKPPRTLVG